MQTRNLNVSNGSKSDLANALNADGIVVRPIGADRIGARSATVVRNPSGKADLLVFPTRQKLLRERSRLHVQTCVTIDLGAYSFGTSEVTAHSRLLVHVGCRVLIHPRSGHTSAQ